MELEGDDRPLGKGKREGPGTEPSDRPTKFPKTITAFEFKDALPSKKGIGGSFKMIDEGDRVTFVAVGKIFDLEKLVWMAGHGFKSEMKVENLKYVVYTPPISATFLKKELEEMTLKQVRYQLKMVPVDTYCTALANAGIRYEECRRALQERFLLQCDDDDDDDEYDEDEDDDYEYDEDEDEDDDYEYDEDEDDDDDYEYDEEDAGDEAEAEMASPKVHSTDTAAASAAITAAADAISAATGAITAVANALNPAEANAAATVTNSFATMTSSLIASANALAAAAARIS